MITARIASLGNTPERIRLIHDIADAFARYRPVQGPKCWGVVDIKTGTNTPAEYESEALAKHGARLLAACDIVEMLEKPAEPVGAPIAVAAQ